MSALLLKVVKTGFFIEEKCVIDQKKQLWLFLFIRRRLKKINNCYIIQEKKIHFAKLKSQIKLLSKLFTETYKKHNLLSGFEQHIVA